MACSWDFDGRHENCSRWSKLWYPRKDSARYPRQVGPIGRTLRESKNVPLSISILPVSSDDMPTETPPSWCCGTFPVIANSHWSRFRANMNSWRIFHEHETLDPQAVPHLGNHPPHDQPFYCTMEPRRTLRIPRTCCADNLWEFWIDQKEWF